MKVIVVVLVALALLLVDADPVGSPIQRSRNSDDIRNYWTAERMMNAKNPVPPPSHSEINATAMREAADSIPLPSGTPGGTRHYVGDDNEVNWGNETTRDARYPFAFTSAYAPSYNTYPWRAVGKVFFTSNNQNWVCSAASASTYMILTAGHCVYDLGVNAWVTNFMFVPGYNNGNAPYGYWSSYQQWTETAYIQSPGGAANPNRAYDFAFVVLNKQNGNGIGPVVGWFGVSWNWGYQLSWRAMGYPSAAPFSGGLNYYCDASLGTIDTNYNPNTPGIGCDTTPGCSGGPWVKDFATNPSINTVNGYYYYAQPQGWYGSYFGNDLASLYNQVNAISPP